MPFIIDPENLANAWLENYLKDKCKNNYEILNCFDHNFINKVELGVKFGKTLLVYGCNGIHPFLYPLLRKETVFHGSRSMVAIGEKTVPFHPNFKIFLVSSKSGRPLQDAEKGLVIQINFSLTKKGISNELLGITLQVEKPGLIELKKTKSKEEEESRVELESFENDLLSILSSTNDDIISNPKLVTTLSQIKAKATSISESLNALKISKLKMEEEQNVYKEFIRFGSNLFFLLSQLHQVRVVLKHCVKKVTALTYPLKNIMRPI